jgi:Bacterial PH domain
MSTDWLSLLYWVIGGVAVIVAALAAVVAVRGRRIPGDHVFRASRWSRGNHVFPAQVAVAPTEVVQYVPGWIGRREHTIHMAHIASVDISTNLFFSNVVIETSGGSDPVRCYGHRKRDALEIKRLINQYQSDYYKADGRKS